MIKHILTILWNQRRKYIGMLLEQALVFIVVVVCLTSLIGAIKRYNSPGLLDTDNVIVFGYMLHSDYTRDDAVRASQQMNVIVENLRKKDYVEAISQSFGFTPYMRPDESYWGDSITISPDRKIYAQFRPIDQWATDVYDIEMIEGRWFTDDERIDGHIPVVVTTQFVEAADMDNPVGKTVNSYFHIVGVIEGVKSSVFSDARPAIIPSVKAVTTPGGIFQEYVAKIKKGYEDNFSSDYYSEIKRLMSNIKNIEMTVSEMNYFRNLTMIDTITEVAFLAIPTIFLLIFAFIGTMGLTLMSLRSRIPELAMRMAIGSTHARLAQFVILQNLIISLLAVIPGLIIAAFVYEWNLTNVTAVALAFGLIIIFSVLSSWYPVRTISRLNPAIALKHE